MCELGNRFQTNPAHLQDLKPIEQATLERFPELEPGNVLVAGMVEYDNLEYFEAVHEQIHLDLINMLAREDLKLLRWYTLDEKTAEDMAIKAFKNTWD